MKQDILCDKCALRRKKAFVKIGLDPKEHVKFVRGRALKDYVCDGCVDKTVLPEGSDVWAYSFWTEGRGVPYFEWEKFYLKVN